MIRLSEIDSQLISTIICDYLICRNCGVINRNYERTQSGYRCQTCDMESDSGTLAFPISVCVLIDLVQQTFHSHAPTPTSFGFQSADVGTILYFCTLREALLNSFLLNNLRTRKIPEPLIRRLLDDNKLASQKFGNLFASVVGIKWKEAVNHATQKAGVDYIPVSVLMQSAAELRNEFLHSGKAWRCTREYAAQCVDSMSELLGLFVTLHNEYTHPLMRRGT